VQIEVKLFALARELAGTGSISLELPDGATVAELRRQLAERYPALAPIVPRLLVAVDSEYATDERRIEPGQEVACLPPVSGGLTPARL